MIQSGTCAVRQRGLGLLEVMLVTVLVAGALVAGLIALKARQPTISAQDAMRAIAQADRSLAGFAAANRRLPCPDSSGSGLEDCASGLQKGRLPYRTLGLEGSGAEAGFGMMGYLVQRNALDLARPFDPANPVPSDNRYEPLAFDGGRTSPAYYTGRRGLSASGTSADFCQSMFVARDTALSPTHAQAGPGYAVAYALIHPGARDADGDGKLLDGRNATDADAVESPERQGEASGYDDRVAVRSYDALAQALDCARFNTSLDTVSMATEVVEEVTAQKQSTLISASILTGLAGVKAIVGGIKIAGSALTIATATGYLSTASALLATAIATCVVLVGCAEIPHASASVVAASVAIGAASVAIALNVAAIAANVVAFGITLAAAIQAGAVQNANIDISAAVSSSRTTWTDRVSATAAANSRLASANSAAAGITTQKDAAWNALIAEAHQIVTDTNNAGNPTKGSMNVAALDGYLTTTRDRADDWVNAQRNLAAAREALKQAQDTANKGTADPNPQTLTDLRAQLAAAQAAGDTARAADLQRAIDQVVALGNSGNVTAQVADLRAQITTINATIDDTNNQIAAATDADQRAALVRQRDDLVARRDSLQAQLATLSFDVAAAQANVNTAQTAVNNALNNFNTSRANAVAAFNGPNLRYTVCIPVKDKPPNCNTYDYDGRSRIDDKLHALYDIRRDYVFFYYYDYNIGVYFQWWDAKEKVRTAQAEYDEAVRQEANAKSAYDSLAGLSIGSGSGGNGSNINPVFTGAESILKQLELRGAVK